MKKIFCVIILAFLFSCHSKHGATFYCYTDIFNCEDPQNHTKTINIYDFTNIDSALCCAKRQKKPILLIFSGWAAMPCHNMEWKTLALFGDIDFIQDNYIITWLPVDDKLKLSDTSMIDTLDGKTFQIKTIGHKNAHLQVKLTQRNCQPMFCIVDTNLTRYGNLMSYTTDENEVKNFVMSGLKK